MEAAMDLMRRISPNHTETALSALLTLLPQNSSDLLSQVDQPLQICATFLMSEGVENLISIVYSPTLCISLFEAAVFMVSPLTKLNSRKCRILQGFRLQGLIGKHVLCDVESGKEFILCEYNRDADSYRSPWSNKYHPPLEDAPLPSADLRKLEVEANDIFAIYRDQYYEGGISSVYMWEDGNEGFVACFLIKKDGSQTGHGRRGNLQEGAWDAIHVIEVGVEEEGMAHYCLTSTVMLSLTTSDKSSGTFNLSGSIRRQMNLDLSVADGHLCNMGRMIEEMESKLRNSLDQVYFGKTKEMVCILRPPLEVVQPRLPEC